MTLRSRPSRRLLSLALVAALGLAACGGDDSEGGESTPDPTDAPSGGEQASGTSVKIVDFDFEPITLAVSVGDEVTWTNDGATHTVSSTDDGGPLDSGNIDGGGTYSATFDEAGTYEYMCKIHPSMTGTVEVS